MARPPLRERARVRRAAPAGRADRPLLRPPRQRAPTYRSNSTARFPSGRFERLTLGGLRRRRARAPAAHRPRRAALAAHAGARPPCFRRQPLLRARDRQGTGRARRAARAGRRAPHPGEPPRARARPARVAPSGGARGRAGRLRALPAHRDGSSTPRSQAGGEPPAAAAAVAAGVLERDGERLAFAHPLLATVAYQLLSADERRALHARLAEILDDPEERARHLALAADEPDESVAGALEQAARRAAARGAPDAAAELLEQARRLTPAEDDDGRRRRGIEAAERHFEAGEVGHARALLEEIVGEAPHGERRARALARLGLGVRARGGLPRGRRRLLRRAGRADRRRQAADRDPRGARLVPALDAQRARRRSSTRAPRSSWRRQLGEPTVLAGALALVAFLDTLGGEGVALATIERALALEHSPPWSQVLGRPDWIHGLLVGWSGALASARETFGVALPRGARSRRRAFAAVRALPARALRVPDRRLGGRAASMRANAEDASVRNGQVGERPFSLAIEAIVEAHLGDVEPAQAKIARGPAARRAHRRPAGRARAARDARLPRALARRRRGRRPHARGASPSGRARPGSSSRRSSASTATRSRPRSRSAAATRRSGCSPSSSSSAARLERAWPLAIAARCRGLLCSALGEPEAALRRARGGARAARPRRRAVRARAHAARARQRAAARAQEAPGARIARGRARDLRGAGRGALGGARARRARARRGPARARRADGDRGARGRAARLRADLPAGRRRALREPEDRAVERLQDLPQARHPLARRADQALRGLASDRRVPRRPGGSIPAGPAVSRSGRAPYGRSTPSDEGAPRIKEAP